MQVGIDGPAVGLFGWACHCLCARQTRELKCATPYAGAAPPLQEADHNARSSRREPGRQQQAYDHGRVPRPGGAARLVARPYFIMASGEQVDGGMTCAADAVPVAALAAGGFKLASMRVLPGGQCESTVLCHFVGPCS